MNLWKDFVNICSDHCNISTTTILGEGKYSQGNRTVPNILKRKRSNPMNFSRITALTTPPTRNVRRKKQIFDPVRNELLTWENFHSTEKKISKININSINDLDEKSSSEINSNVLEYSPMWCPPSIEQYLDGYDIKIIETVTINFPIGDITNSICNQFIESEFYDFNHEMNLPIDDTKSSDIETTIELSRFECNINYDKVETTLQKDPLVGVIIKSSWDEFECLCCERIYRSQSGLNKHLKIHHHSVTKNSPNPIIVLTCPRCFKIFKTNRGYEQHIIRFCNISAQLKEE